MGANSQKAFTTDKLKKFGASGNGNTGARDRDKAATSDDYGRSAAKTSDCSAFAQGGAAKAPSLGRAARAAGGRIARADGGKTRDISKVSDGGPQSYGDRPLIRAKGGRIGKQLGGALANPQGTPPGTLTPPPRGQPPGLPGLGRWKGGPTRDVLGQKDVYAEEKPEWLDTSIPGQHEYYDFLRGGLGMRSVGAPQGQGGIGSDEAAEPPRQANGGRVGRARGGRAKGAKGKTVVNIVVGHGKDQQPPAPPPQAAPGPVPPPMPPPQHPPMPPGGPPGAGGGGPPMAGPPGAPMGPAGAPPGGGGGLPPQLLAALAQRGGGGGPMPGRASGGRISQKFGAGSGQGRMANAKRNNSGKIELAE